MYVCHRGNGVIKGRIIVCIASSWDYDPTSKHQIMKVLSRENDIVWINYHGTRRPRINRNDLRTGWSVLGRVARGIHRVSPSILQVTPLVIPGAANPLLQRIHEGMLIAQIRRAIRSVDGWEHRPLQVWSFAPDVPYLVGKFNEECFLYYCVDEYCHFEGLDPDRILRAETELVRRADFVVATSQALLETKGAIRDDVTLVRHGVDYDHFSAAWRRPLERPRDLRGVPDPIFGFFGLIQYWVDLPLLVDVARRRPDYSFVLIGDCVVDVGLLERLPNVFLLGRRRNEDLPAYCAAFEAGLMPFVRSRMTRNINPIKMYEYLAAGLPIVSTPLPEAERYLGPITMADNAADFAAACDQVLASRHAGRSEAIATTVHGESWLSKVEFLSALVQRSAHGSNGRPVVSRPIEHVMAGAGVDPMPVGRAAS